MRNGKGIIQEYDKGSILIYEGELLNTTWWILLDNNILYELKEGKGYIKEYTLNYFLYLNGNIKMDDYMER